MTFKEMFVESKEDYDYLLESKELLNEGFGKAIINWVFSIMSWGALAATAVGSQLDAFASMQGHEGGISIALAMFVIFVIMRIIVTWAKQDDKVVINVVNGQVQESVGSIFKDLKSAWKKYKGALKKDPEKAVKGIKKVTPKPKNVTSSETAKLEKDLVAAISSKDFGRAKSISMDFIEQNTK